MSYDQCEREPFVTGDCYQNLPTGRWEELGGSGEWVVRVGGGVGGVERAGAVQTEWGGQIGWGF